MSYTYDTRRPQRRGPSHRGYHTARARTNGKTGRSGAEEEEDSPLGGAQSSGSPTGGKEPQESEAPRAPTGGGEARRPPPVNWPVEREGSGAKIGKENILVEERPVPKEGIRIRKDVMEDRSPHLVYLVTLDTRSARMPLHIGRFCGLGPTPFCGERRSRAFPVRGKERRITQMAVEERVRPLSAMYILGYLSKGVAEFAELAPDTYLEREASYTTPRRAARLPTPKKGGKSTRRAKGR